MSLGGRFWRKSIVRKHGNELGCSSYCVDHLSFAYGWVRIATAYRYYRAVSRKSLNIDNACAAAVQGVSDDCVGFLKVEMFGASSNLLIASKEDSNRAVWN